MDGSPNISGPSLSPDLAEMTMRVLASQQANNVAGRLAYDEMFGSECAEHEQAQALMASFVRQLSAIRSFDQQRFAEVLADWVGDATGLDGRVLQHVARQANRASA